jgi:hypothetical protein
VNRHHTKQKGDIGLTAVIKDLTVRGYFISLPITENAPFDLIASDLKDNYRIQVKARSSRNGTVEVQLKTSWADKTGSHYARYSEDDFDILAVYALDEDKCLYIKNDGEKSITIRFSKPKNNQQSRVNVWQDFQLFPPSETIRDAPKD